MIQFAPPQWAATPTPWPLSALTLASTPTTNPGSADSPSPEGSELSLLRDESTILQNELAAHKRSEALALKALAAGKHALADAQSEGNSQAEAVAQHAVDLATEVLDKARNLRAEDETQLASVRSALASQKALITPGQNTPREALHARLAALRAELVGLQEALRRLSRSAQLDAAQRTQWEAISNDAAADAWKRGINMATDGLGRYTLGRLHQGIKDVDKGIEKAVTQLAGETDPNRREQLHAAIKLLAQQKKSLEQAVRDVEHAQRREESFEKAADALNWDTASPAGLEGSAKAALEAAQHALDNRGVQQALNLSPGMGEAAKLGQSILGSGYDITAETVSIKRVNALNKDSEEYLAAVNKLQQRMKTTVSQIKVIEAELGSTGNVR